MCEQQKVVQLDQKSNLVAEYYWKYERLSKSSSQFLKDSPQKDPIFGLEFYAENSSLELHFGRLYEEDQRVGKRRKTPQTQ